MTGIEKDFLENGWESIHDPLPVPPKNPLEVEHYLKPKKRLSYDDYTPINSSMVGWKMDCSLHSRCIFLLKMGDVIPAIAM